MLYQIGRFLVASWFFLFTRRVVEGKDNVPVTGPILVVANHLNTADPPLIGICLGRKAIFMAKAELFGFAPIGFILHAIGAFPVNRRRPGKDSIRKAEEVLAGGAPLVMFPESTRSKTGAMRTGFPGAAMVAIKTGVSVLPVGITGTEKLKGATWWLTRPTIRVKIGTPFNLNSEVSLTKENLSSQTDVIMYKIASLLPDEYRGRYI